jgi:hypothetical protein
MNKKMKNGISSLQESAKDQLHCFQDLTLAYKPNSPILITGITIFPPADSTFLAAINDGLLPKDLTGERPVIVIDVPSIEEPQGSVGFIFSSLNVVVTM